MKTLSNILLIEDFQDIRNWLSGLLRETFCVTKITEAATVAQAYSHLALQKFELIVVDLNLPDGAGVDILRRIKSLGLTAHCVVATTYDDDVHLLTALAAGADGYLLKDQPGEQLMRDLSGILDGSHVGAIYSKLDISSRAEATIEALRRGLIST